MTKKSSPKKKKIKINPDMNLAEFIIQYPDLVDVLMYEFGFHCVNCIFSGMDTIRQGASLHMIEGNDFDEMIEYLEDYINNPE